MKKHRTDMARPQRVASPRWATASVALLVLVVTNGSQVVYAQGNDAPGAGTLPASEIDHATNQWLVLQRGNTEAAPVQPMLGAEASLAYKRYLESFNSKIPEFYGSSIGQGSSGSSGGLGGASSQN
jgi:hypothetical protein